MDDVSKVREKIDIVSLVSEFIPLKKMGRNFKALCPFHSEKTPSFVVSPERQIWHCFGCQKGGDCFTFLMEYENLEFPEALRTLAARVGVTIESERFATGVASKKERMYRLNRMALEFYHFLLTKHNVGKRAQDYLLKKRKLSLPLLETFTLGFAPRIGNALTSYLIQKKHYKKEELFDAGLAVQKGSLVGDFFVNRIIFPLFDHRDNVIGFSGRLMEESSSSSGFYSPKYVNTKETLVYQKGNTFFGLNLAKQAIKAEQSAIVVEGEFDVISAFQEGVKNIIAIKGTALSEQQVNLLSRFTNRVSLCLDMDEAGEDAIKRSVSLLEKKGIAASVIELPNGKDPDESIHNNSLIFKKSVKESVGVYDYLFVKALSQSDSASAEGKKRISDALLPYFVHIDNEIVKEHYLKKLSDAIQTSYESINRQVEKLTKEESVAKPIFKDNRGKKTREEILEQYVLSLLLQAKKPKEMFAKATPLLAEVRFTSPAYQKIVDMLSYFFSKQGSDITLFMKSLPKELLPAFDVCYLYPLPVFSDDEKYADEILKVVAELKMLRLRSKIKALGEKIKNKEKDGTEDELKTLREELSTLLLRLQSI